MKIALIKDSYEKWKNSRAEEKEFGEKSKNDRAEQKEAKKDTTSTNNVNLQTPASTQPVHDHTKTAQQAAQAAADISKQQSAATNTTNDPADPLKQNPGNTI